MRKAWKKSGLNGIQAHDLCDTSTVNWRTGSGRALHLLHRDHGVESRSILDFFRLSFRIYSVSCLHNCDAHSLIHSFIRSSNICISYIRLRLNYTNVGCRATNRWIQEFLKERAEGTKKGKSLTGFSQEVFRARSLKYSYVWN